MKAGRSPPPKHLPFALVEAGAKGLRLVAVNAMARSFGLTRGQRLADARAAVPDLVSEIHEPEQDIASLLGLCRWMERYSPWVAPEPPDGILLDVTGIPHLFGGEAEMLTEMRRRLAAYGFTARTGIAETIGAAWALARYSHPLPHAGEEPPLRSNGEGEGERTVLESLPIEALRIDADSARTLRRLGLKTIGALLDIPRASLARRFRGETIAGNVLLRLDEAMGHREEVLNPLNPPSSFMAHRALMEPVITPEGLEAVLTGLAHALARDLEKKSQGVTRLILKLFKTDGSRLSLPAGFSAPANDATHLLRILKPKLETVDAGFGIDAMTLEARETAEALTRQYGFMEDADTRAIEELNDRVMNREDVGLAALEAVESHIPERAEAASAPSSAPSGHLLPQGEKEKTKRPLLIFETAEPAFVIASVPDGPPMRFTWRKVTRRVVRSEGPERIAPEWWRLTRGERPRDYYVIEDERGRRYWLYREGFYGEAGEEAPRWFVHGLSP